MFRRALAIVSVDLVVVVIVVVVVVVHVVLTVVAIRVLVANRLAVHVLAAIFFVVVVVVYFFHGRLRCWITRQHSGTSALLIHNQRNAQDSQRIVLAFRR